MKHAYFLLCLVPLFFTACSDDYLIDRKEDKLIGTWEFEKAFYKADNKLFRDDITGEFADDIIVFYGDYTAVYDDFSEGIVYPGDWEIILDEDYYYTEDGSSFQNEFFIDAMFYDPSSTDDFAFFGTIHVLNKNRLTFEARDRNGRYTFKLCRR